MTDPREVLDAFFEEMESRHWSTDTQEVQSARNATLRRFHKPAYQTDYDIYELVTDDFGDAVYARCKKEIPAGEVIVYDGYRYEAQYSWLWLRGLGLYMAELKPMGKEDT